MFEKNQGKILGILGGMGPLATNLFYKMIIEKTDAHKDQEHLNMIILNHATMPDRTQAILSGDLEPLYKELYADGNMLKRNGVSAIAVPCNTSHILLDRLEEAIELPFVNMIRETVKRICNKDRLLDSNQNVQQKIGILATEGTINSELYQRECEKKDITPVILSGEYQKLVSKIIYEGIKNGGEIDYRDFEKIEGELKRQNCSGAILGCTELSVFKEIYNLSDFYIDAMGILAEESIIICGKRVKYSSNK